MFKADHSAARQSPNGFWSFLGSPQTHQWLKTDRSVRAPSALGLLGGEMQAGLSGQLQCSSQDCRVTNSTLQQEGFLHRTTLPWKGQPDSAFPPAPQLPAACGYQKLLKNDRRCCASSWWVNCWSESKEGNGWGRGGGDRSTSPTQNHSHCYAHGGTAVCAHTGDTAWSTSRWKQLVHIIFQIIRHFCWQPDRGWQGDRREKGESAGNSENGA